MESVLKTDFALANFANAKSERWNGGRFQHGVPDTWQLPWLAVEWPWLPLAGPFLMLLAQMGTPVRAPSLVL